MRGPVEAQLPWALGSRSRSAGGGQSRGACGSACSEPSLLCWRHCCADACGHVSRRQRLLWGRGGRVPRELQVMGWGSRPLPLRLLAEGPGAPERDTCEGSMEPWQRRCQREVGGGEGGVWGGRGEGEGGGGGGEYASVGDAFGVTSSSPGTLPPLSRAEAPPFPLSSMPSVESSEPLLLLQRVPPRCLGPPKQCPGRRCLPRPFARFAPVTTGCPPAVLC